jgi:hypothetical protein
MFKGVHYLLQIAFLSLLIEVRNMSGHVSVCKGYRSCHCFYGFSKSKVTKMLFEANNVHL